MLTIRSASLADVDSIAQVHVDSWRTTYARLISAEYLKTLSVSARAKQWRRAVDSEDDRSFLLVSQVERGGASPQVVGFASGGPERTGDAIYTGEIYAIYLLQEFQGQGIGRRLMRSAVEYLVQHDINSLLIWVLVGNPAAHFYAALGGQLVREKVETLAGQELVEKAYGWDHARMLDILSRQAS